MMARETRGIGQSCQFSLLGFQGNGRVLFNPNDQTIYTRFYFFEVALCLHTDHQASHITKSSAESPPVGISDLLLFGDIVIK